MDFSYSEKFISRSISVSFLKIYGIIVKVLSITYLHRVVEIFLDAPKVLVTDSDSSDDEDDQELMNTDENWDTTSGSSINWGMKEDQVCKRPHTFTYYMNNMGTVMCYLYVKAIGVQLAHIFIYLSIYHKKS